MKQTEYAHWGMQIAQVCMFVHAHGMLPRLKASGGLRIDDEKTRTDLVEALSAFVRSNDMTGLAPGKKLEIIVLATEFALKRNLSEVDDGALLLATIINMSDVIAHDQRILFPDDRPMRDLADNLTAMLAPMKTKIFGNTIPDDVCRAWPDFARLFGVSEPSVH